MGFQPKEEPFMDFSGNELKVIKYALEWMNSPDTFESDFNDHPQIWEDSFGSLEMQEVLEIHTRLLERLKKR